MQVDLSRLVYGDFMHPDAEPRAYIEIKDTPRMLTTVEVIIALRVKSCMAVRKHAREFLDDAG